MIVHEFVANSAENPGIELMGNADSFLQSVVELGAPGKTILSGDTIPTTQGVDGDFYIDVTAAMLYGPKTSGAWGTGLSLTGPSGSIWRDGQGIPSGSLGSDGDYYLDDATGNVHLKIAGTYSVVANIKGAAVLNGIIAPTAEGVDGDFYINTAASLLYGPKTAGSWGLGASLVGPAGNTILNGDTFPTTEGVDGDFYFDTWDARIYGPKTSGSWGAGIYLIGNDGSDGIDGKTILSGTISPTVEGVDGDFYINTSDKLLYGPKTAGVWGSPTSLVGPSGNTVLNGNAVPTTEGVDGDFYINTSTEMIYGPKTVGAWGAGMSLVGPSGSVWRDGSGVPSDSLGVNGDYYLDDSTSNVYLKSAGTYSIVANIRGATAIKGGDIWANRATLAASGSGIYRITDLPSGVGSLWYYDGSKWRFGSVLAEQKTDGWIVPSMLAANAATYTQSGTTITVNATAHGLQQNDATLNGSKVYLIIGSGAATTGWYTNFQCSNANQFTCTSSISQTTSGTVNTNTAETTITDCTTSIKGGLLGNNGHIKSNARYYYSNNGATKTMRYYLGAQGIYLPTTNISTSHGSHIFTVNNVNSETKQRGYGTATNSGGVTAGTSTWLSLAATVDTTTNQNYTVTVQLSAAQSYIHMQQLLLEIFPS